MKVCPMKNVLLGALACLAIAVIAPASAAGAGGETCFALPAHTPKVERHGQSHWSDQRLRVYSSIASGVAIPAGWIPIGGDRIDAGCAFFPPKQAALFINPGFWQVESIESVETGLSLQLLSLKTTPPEELASWREMVSEVYRDVSTLFPLGLLPDQKLPHVILVTAGIAGDGKRMSTRLFPDAGANLTSLFYNPGDGRGRDLFIHTTTHLFNKRRPRPEVLPREPDLPKSEYREMVASWAEIAFNRDDDYVRKRVAMLMKQHVALTDNDPDTWPALSFLREIRSEDGPFGIPPNAPKGSKAAREYAHYYLAPLILLAIDGLLVERGTVVSVRMTLRDIHAGNSTGLLASLPRILLGRSRQVRGWMDGTEQIPAELVQKGLARLQDRVIELGQ
jgi:hypothetical protein